MEALVTASCRRFANYTIIEGAINARKLYLVNILLALCSNFSENLEDVCTSCLIGVGGGVGGIDCLMSFHIYSVHEWIRLRFTDQP
jgi:hypothetical protein